MNFKRPTKKMIHTILLIGIFIAFMALNRPWYEIILAYLGYFILNFFLFFGTSLGNLGYFIQAVIHKKDLAIKFYELALKFNTKSNLALMAYGLELLRDYQPERALELFQRNIQIKSTKPLLVKYAEMNLATCHWKLGNIKKSIEILEDMLERYEVFSPDFYTTLGFMYLLNDDTDQALFYSKKALKENRDHGPAYDNLGQVYYKLNDLDLAGKYFRKALKLRDTMADSKYYLGLIYEQQGDIDKAKEYFKKAHDSNINGLNTITREEVDRKYQAYFE